MYASISADIVSSTSQIGQSMIDLNNRLKEGLSILEKQYNGFWGRIVRGDTIECIIKNPVDALEIALILKSWIKAYEPNHDNDNKRLKKYGLRLAIGIGNINTIDKELDIIDGEAIYLSGRSLDKLTGHSKYSMTISMANKQIEEPLSVIIELINQLITNATGRRCLILFERLLTSSSSETAKKLEISISGVNQSLNELGWAAIESAIKYYRKTVADYVGKSYI